MTTIAVKDGIMASDSQASRGDLIDQIDVRKIHEYEGGLIGIAGNYHDGQILVAYLKGAIEQLPNDLECEGLILSKRGKPRSILVSNGVAIEHEVPNMYAIGSGACAARAAMMAGASAGEAVKIAIKLDAFSGGKVQEVDRKGFK